MSDECICEPGHGHRSGLPRDPADGDRVIGCPKPGPGGVERPPRAELDLDVVRAERDGALEAYDKMRADRDAALRALHRIRQALSLGGSLTDLDGLAARAERMGEQLRRMAAGEGGETDDLGPLDFANGNQDDHRGFFAMGGRKLSEALRAYHEGSDRGELKALLCEAWGPSPALHGQATDILERLNAKVAGIIERGASDLRGLAARESMREPVPSPTSRTCICEECPAVLPCPCDCHVPPSP